MTQICQPDATQLEQALGIYHQSEKEIYRTLPGNAESGGIYAWNIKQNLTTVPYCITFHIQNMINGESKPGDWNDQGSRGIF